MLQEAGGRVNKEGAGKGRRGKGKGRGQGRGITSRGSGSRDNACDVQWNLVESDDDLVTCPTAAFTENTGPQTPLTEASQPVDFFRHFFDDDILALLVDETNM